MYFSKTLLIFCLLCITFVNAARVVCEREPGDSLLSSQPLLQVSLFHRPRVHKSFVGYRITCVELNLPLGLGSLVSLSILNGGTGCDFVGLQISVGSLLTIGVGLNIYGVKASPDEIDDPYCRSSIEDNSDGGLLGDIFG